MMMRKGYQYLPEEHNDFLWAVVGSPWGLLALWLIAINLVTFLAFGVRSEERRVGKEC